MAHSVRMAPRSPSGTPALVLLKRAGISHHAHAYRHDPAGTSYGEEAAAALDVDPMRLFKTLMVAAESTVVVAVVPVSCSLDLKALAGILGTKRASMLSAARAERLTGYVVGGISPLGQRESHLTIVDDSALHHATIFVSGGRRGLDIELDPCDLINLTRARVLSITAVGA